MEPQAQGVFNALKLAQRARPPSEELNPAAHWGGMAAGAPIGSGIGATMDDGEGGNLAAEGALMGMMGGGPAAGSAPWARAACKRPGAALTTSCSRFKRPA